MFRNTNIDPAEGHYYAVLLGNGGRPIYFSDADKQNFTELVGMAVARHGARIHAFCWCDNEARLTLQVRKSGLGRVVQVIASQHARAINRQLGESGYVFRHPYRSIEIPERRLLLDVVRHIHLTPLEIDAVADLADYRWSSHRAYLSLDRIGWLTTQVVLDLLEPTRTSQLDAYHRFIATAVRVHAHTPQGPATPRYPGRRWFFDWLRKYSVVRPKIATMDQVTRAVATRLGLDVPHLMSESRERSVTLGRALIAWHCVQNDIATLTEVSRHLRRSPSTMHSACRRLRPRHQALFNEPLPKLLLTVVPADPTHR